jgi:aminoglycoside phosphotransferase family enzyme/predicted kinase
MTDTDAARFVEAMHDPAAYPHPVAAIRLIETHISWVFLTGSSVYKVKKPVSFGFVDFHTLERRRHFCHEEIRASGRFAPALYLAAVPITGTPDRPRVDGAGEPFEWAVRLAQFDERERLDARFAAGRLGAGDCERLGAEIAAIHARLAVAPPDAPWGTADIIGGAATLNLGQIRACRPDAAARADRLGGWLTGRLETLRPTIAARRASGRVRECHGDLHLANIVFHDGRMTPFDAIEFNEALRWIDVANDVAFLTMDLAARGRPDLAAHVTSSWIEVGDDHAAMAVLPAYEAYRAIVRAAVAALRGGQTDDHAVAVAARDETDRYLALAERLATARRPWLLATCGVSGSGKTTLSAALVGACSAVRIRSDVERKRLTGMGQTDRPADAAAARALYGTAMTRRVYERLASLAGTILAAGGRVVVDATCNLRSQREVVARAARAAGAGLVWLDLETPADTLFARVAARAADGHDASDASLAVVREQLAGREPLTDDEAAAQGATVVRIRPEDTPAAVVARVTARLSRPA